jgi:alpha-glucosidase
LSVQAQDADPGSMLSLYRDALRIRRIHPVLGSAGSELEWLDLGDDVIAFRRQAGFTCIVNLGATDIELPPGEVVLSSVPVTETIPGTIPSTIPGTIPSDTTVWLDTPGSCPNSRSAR